MIQFSLIIPVFNRPNELEELLESLTKQTFTDWFEVVVIEDGSSISSKTVVDAYVAKLNLSYYNKPNTGPGDSRNYGMRKAKGSYFLIFDSDCIIPPTYLSEVSTCLQVDYVDCFGGPDAAMDSFSVIQKAINYSMTSVMTTGGVRGNTKNTTSFQPRSFNMGLSKNAFNLSHGFGNIHPGEDPELIFRLWKMGFKTKLFTKAYVFHKRRIDFKKFYVQVNKFGKVRPILDLWHPEYVKKTFWFPTLFVAGFVLSILLLALSSFWLLAVYLIYFIALCMSALVKTKSIKIAGYVVLATFVQFYGYGIGYLQSTICFKIFKNDPKKVFPNLFFKLDD